MKKLSVLFAGKIFIEPFPLIGFFKKHMYRSFRMVVCFVFLQTLVTKNYGQSYNYIPQTPAAAQYEKYINYPVSHSTGAASIEVPLHVLKAGSIDVPVNISYHTSGVKPSDPSLPVGLGWTINPGARVTRKILGYPDEGGILKPPYTNLVEEFSPTGNIQQLQNLEYEGSQVPTSSYTATYDGEYDVFTYYTGTGITGKFVIKKQGTEYVAMPLISTRDKIKVYVASNGGAHYIDYIEITDANGMYYRFGKPLTTYSNNVLIEMSNSSAVTGWMLTDIISADKADTVNFRWTDVENSAGGWYKQTGLLDMVTVTDSYGGAPINPNDCPCTPSYTDVPQYIYGQFTEVNYVASIISSVRYKNEEVKFLYTEGSGVPTKLNSMEVYSNGSKKRQVDFHKSLFSNGMLRLDSISLIDMNSQAVSRYRFGYNVSTQFPSDPTHTRQLDYWGYFNGQISNASLIPNFSYYVIPFATASGWVTFSSANRNPHSENAQTFILNSVTYPTGGKTTYEYESNLFGSGPQATLAGGLRVKKINHWIADGQLAETRSYQYGNGEGYPMEANMYAKTEWIGSFTYQNNGNWANPYYRKSVISNDTKETVFALEFPAVTYQTVTEYIGDASGNNSGKIVYNYSPSDVLTMHTFPFSTDRFSGMAKYYDNPRLENTTYYKNSSGNYIPVRSISNSYGQFITDTIKSMVVRRFANFINPEGALIDLRYVEQNFSQFYQIVSVYLYKTAYLYCGGAVLQSTQTTEYPPSGSPIVITQTYGYVNNDYLYPKTLTSTNSNGATTITHYTYPKDYDVGNSPTNSVAQGIKLLKDRNVVAPVIEEYTEVQPGNKIKSGRFTTYKTDKPLAENMYVLNTGAASSFIPASITSSAHTKSSLYELKNTVDLYDQYGNVRQFVDQNEGINTVLLYSYGGKHTIAVIRNTTYASVASVLGGDAVINSFASTYPTEAQVNSFLSSLRSSLPQAQVTTYTFQPMIGMTSQTDIVGRTTTYHYDPFGRLSYVKDKDGNVVKRICYNYLGQPGNCALVGNVAKSQNFIKSCTSGTGTTVSYSVPANKYYGSTQTEADALAQAEIDANGQAYANANGTCSAPQATIYVSNSTNDTYYLSFYNTTTYQNYGVSLNPWDTPTMTVPEGTYTVSITPSGSNYPTYFYAIGYSTYGTSAYFSNVSVSGTSNFVSIGD